MAKKKTNAVRYQCVDILLKRALVLLTNFEHAGYDIELYKGVKDAIIKVVNTEGGVSDANQQGGNQTEDQGN